MENESSLPINRNTQFVVVQPAAKSYSLHSRNDLKGPSPDTKISWSIRPSLTITSTINIFNEYLESFWSKKFFAEQPESEGERVYIRRWANIDIPLGAILPVYAKEPFESYTSKRREQGMDKNYQEMVSNVPMVTGKHPALLKDNDTLCAEDGVNPQLAGALYEMYFALGGEIDDSVWIGPTPPDANNFPFVAYHKEMLIPPMLRAFPHDCGHLVYGLPMIYGFEVESIEEHACHLEQSGHESVGMYSVAVPAWAWRRERIAPGSILTAFCVDYDKINADKHQMTADMKNIQWIDSACAQWDANSFRALWLLAAQHSDTTGVISLPINPLYVTLLEAAVRRYGLLRAVQEWERAIAKDSDGWVWRLYSIGFAWVHWMAKPAGLKQMSAVLNKRISCIRDLIMELVSFHDTEELFGIVKKWAHECLKGAQCSIILPLEPENSPSRAVSRLVQSRLDVGLLPILYRYSHEAVRDMELSTVDALKAVELAVAADVAAVATGDCSVSHSPGLGIITRELLHTVPENTFFYSEFGWSQKSIAAQEHAQGQVREIKKSELKRTIKHIPNGIGLSFVHTFLSDVLLIGRLEEEELTIVISQCSGRYVELREGKEVNDLIEELNWMLQDEEMYLREMFGKCGQSDMMHAIMIWLILVRAICVKGPSNGWERVKGRRWSAFPKEWLVHIQGGNWHIEVPTFLEHAVHVRDDGSAELLLKNDESSVLLYYCENDRVASDGSGIHHVQPSVGFMARVPNMKRMCWDSRLRVRG